MSDQALFITENKLTLPTLSKINPDQAKNMQELFKEMEGLIDYTNTNVNQMLSSQQSSILKAFKQVLETMKKDIERINESFLQYVACHEQEQQVVNSQSKTVYFRQECHNLNEQCKLLQQKIQKLAKANQYLENELMFTKEALLIQVQKNEKLKQTLQRFKEQLNEQQVQKNQNYQILPTEPKIASDFHYQILPNVNKRGKFDSFHKKDTSFNSITNSDTKSKFVSQQTRAQSLQKSILTKKSALFDTSILEKSLQQNQTFEYSKYQSVKQDIENNQ